MTLGFFSPHIKLLSYCTWIDQEPVFKNKNVVDFVSLSGLSDPMSRRPTNSFFCTPLK